MQAAARLAGQGLGHKAGVQPVAPRDGPCDLLEHHDVVGRFEGAGIVEIDLVLAAAALVVAVLGGQAHLLHGQADVAAQVLGGVQGVHVKVAPLVDGDAGWGGPGRRFRKGRTRTRPPRCRSGPGA